MKRPLISDVDFFLCMGQSNMAGRGKVTPEHPEPAPVVISGAGYEYRAVTAPDTLTPLTEPFGGGENRADGIDDPRKSGSLMAAFVNEWYARTKTPVVGVAASKGGSSILRWQPGTPYLADAESRVQSAFAFLSREHIRVRHAFLLWCQGETDGDHGMTKEEYCARFADTLSTVLSWGLTHCYMIKIGQYNGSAGYDYSAIHAAQEELSRTDSRVSICSRLFETMRARGLMQDDFHYYQQAYNEVGADAARHIAADCGF